MSGFCSSSCLHCPIACVFFCRHSETDCRIPILSERQPELQWADTSTAVDTTRAGYSFLCACQPVWKRPRCASHLAHHQFMMLKISCLQFFNVRPGVAIQPWGVALVVVRPATTLQPCYINVRCCFVCLACIILLIVMLNQLTTHRRQASARSSMWARWFNLSLLWI